MFSSDAVNVSTASCPFSQTVHSAPSILSSSTMISNFCLRRTICVRTRASIFSMIPSMFSSSSVSFILPASILDISSTSLISPSRCWLEKAIFFVYSCTFSEFLLSLSSSVVKPTIAFIGVLISWLILERKRLLDWFASSAI